MYGVSKYVSHAPSTKEEPVVRAAITPTLAAKIAPNRDMMAAAMPNKTTALLRNKITRRIEVSLPSFISHREINVFVSEHNKKAIASPIHEDFTLGADP